MKALKAIGALLDYPADETIAALDEIARCIAAELALPSEVRRGLERLIHWMRRSDPMTLQETYVALFDRSRRLSLHLYEHVHGESRDRGQAMVDLAMTYRLHGFELACPEMPDYLPLFCEFLSQIPESAARSYLGQAAAILEALRLRLTERDSPYAAAMEALVGLSGRTADRAEVAAILEGEPADPESPEALDAAWSEEPVTFGAAAALGDCPYGRDPLTTAAPAARRLEA